MELQDRGCFALIKDQQTSELIKWYNSVLTHTEIRAYMTT